MKKEFKQFKKYLKGKGYVFEKQVGLNEFVTDHTWKDLYILFTEYFNNNHIEPPKTSKKLFDNNDITVFKLVLDKKFGKLLFD